MSVPAKNKWKVDPKYDILTLDELKFLFSLAEKQLAAISESSQNVVNRATSLLTIVAALTVSLIGFLINRWSKNDTLSADSLTITAVVGFSYLCGLLYLLSQNIKGIGHYNQGQLPSEMFIDYFIDPYFADPNEPNKREKEYYRTQLELYQEKIEENLIIIGKRWTLQNLALKCLTLLPFILILCYFILSLLWD